MTDRFSRLLYVGDPMCSWCWGFAPEIEKLADEYPTEVVVGGLRPGPMAQPIDDRMAEFLRHHWVEIAERTGQPFDTTFLDKNEGWLYDTEPAAIAVTSMRDLKPAAALDYFTSIQLAFYGRGEDVTDLTVLARLAGSHGVDRTSFAARLATDEAKQAAWKDFSQARNWGISGFPTLVGELDDGRLALLSRGFATAEVIKGRMDETSRQLTA